MYINKRMAFTISELPLRNTLPFTCSHCSSIFKSPKKHSFLLPISYSSLKTTQPHKNPHSKSSQNPPKTPNSAPWLKKWPNSDQTHVSTIDNEHKSSYSRGNLGENSKGGSAIERIVHRLRNLGLDSDDDDDDEEEMSDFDENEKLGDLLKKDWIRNDTMLVEEEKRSDLGLLPWEREEVVGEVREERGGERRAKRVVKAATLAELTIEESELKRLRGQGMVLRDKVNVPKAGLTQVVLQKIHDKWRKSELVRLKFHEELAHDMKTAHILVERRSGGLVIWRSGSVMVVYRGKNYQGPPSKPLDASSVNIAAVNNEGAAGASLETVSPQAETLEPGRILTAEEAEYNELLDSLGPRFVDWWGTGVLPVDADLLPETVPGFTPPLRLLPVGMRVGLTNAELTNLRKLAKSLPCHFALGRNRNHQGLASAIIKLWEKSLVAKIAVKQGIQNTNNKLMSEELKTLTGGTLLLRNKFFIVIYRGKDFLPRSVAAAVMERQELTKKIQDAEESARTGSVETTSYNCDEYAPAGTLAEFYEAQSRWGSQISAEERKKMKQEASAARNVKEVKRIEHKLALAQSKKLRAETLLAKIEATMMPIGPSDDQETITDEERFTFRRIGLRMRAYLPVGVRGIFDGVIENMHLHWKHRELVKLISKQKTLAFVEETARLLEYESGGILVAIERVPKGYALIYYRGKNYQRPISLRPRNLLTKAKALKRAVAMQRHEALSQHISELEKNIDQMKKDMGYNEDGEGGKALSSDEEIDLASDTSQSASMIYSDSDSDYEEDEDEDEDFNESDYEEDEDINESDDDPVDFTNIEDHDKVSCLKS